MNSILRPAMAMVSVIGRAVIFTSRGKGGEGSQLVELTPDKKVVRVLQDWKTLGDATAVQILNDPGFPGIPGESGR